LLFDPLNDAEKALGMLSIEDGMWPAFADVTGIALRRGAELAGSRKDLD
jgi:hypothetical protein